MCFCVCGTCECLSECEYVCLWYVCIFLCECVWMWYVCLYVWSISDVCFCVCVWLDVYIYYRGFYDGLDWVCLYILRKFWSIYFWGFYNCRIILFVIFRVIIFIVFIYLKFYSGLRKNIFSWLLYFWVLLWKVV